MSVALPNTAADRMTARTAIVAVAVLIATAVGVAFFIGRGSDTSSLSDDRSRLAPAFSLEGLRPGEPGLRLSSTAGKPTVLNFFAAWCEPCKKELPALRDAAAAHPEIAFIGVDHKDSRDDAIDLLNRFGVNYSAGYDPRGDVGASFGLRGLPATVFIDPAGRIVKLHQGELTPAQIEKNLRELATRSGAE